MERMTPEATAVWTGLEFRKPGLLQLLEPLTPEQMAWLPPGGTNSIAWTLWHIVEVEENWMGACVLGEERRHPFGVSVRDATPEQYPSKRERVEYLHEVRAISRRRLEQARAGDFDRIVTDENWGDVPARDIWAGLVTSFAWHSGQIALMRRLLI